MSSAVSGASLWTRSPRAFSYQARGFLKFQDDLDLLLEREGGIAPPPLLLGRVQLLEVLVEGLGFGCLCQGAPSFVYSAGCRRLQASRSWWRSSTLSSLR
jgi:hypothetical protein